MRPAGTSGSNRSHPLVAVAPKAVLSTTSTQLLVVSKEEIPQPLWVSVPVLHHLQNTEVLADVQREAHLFQFVSITFLLTLDTAAQSQAPCSLHLSLRYLQTWVFLILILKIHLGRVPMFFTPKPIILHEMLAVFHVCHVKLLMQIVMLLSNDLEMLNAFHC